MRGLGGLLIIIAIICFSGAGSWVWKNVSQLGMTCYTALESAGGTRATPICDAIAQGVAKLDSALDGLSQKFQSWKESTFGDTSSFDAVTSSIGDRLRGMASSNDTLTRMMNAGPSSFGSETRQSMQQAIDSFTIGQGYMKQGTSSEALAWFQQGAQQPQGYGVMSQLQLGNLYMTGNGVPQSNQTASVYLQQASNSISTLMGSNTPQAQQLLSSLPGSPAQIKLQIENALRQLKARR